MITSYEILNKITHIAQGKLMYRIIGLGMGGMFFCNKESVKAIADDMGVSSAYITKMLKELVDIGVLKKGCKGVYILS
jgi:hypothetical protein